MGFVPVPVRKWPFPAGYQSRIAPPLFAHIFSLFSRGEDYAWDWIDKHKLRDCHVAHVVPFCMGLVDSMLKEHVHGFINFPMTEQIARTVYSHEVAFRNVWAKEHWLKPSEGQKGR